MTWNTLSTEQRVNAIQQVYPSSCKTASGIAVGLSLAFDTAISRNAVVGVYSRHKDALKDFPLVGKKAGAAIARGMRMQTVKKPKVTIEPKKPGLIVRRPERLMAALATVKKPEPALKLLFELAARDCRWPVDGEGAETRFCCAPSAAGSSYCEYHRLISVGRGTESERNAHRVSVPA